MKKKLKIGVVGLGNLGWNLSLQLFERGFQVRQIVAKPDAQRVKFAKRIDADLVERTEDLKDKLDLIFLCVPDDRILEIAHSIPSTRAAIIHCSGNTPLLEIPGRETGVFYPFQTFTKYFSVEWRGVPIFIESSSDDVRSSLRKLAQELSMNVKEIDFSQRRALHIAGVFGANFTNHLLYQCKRLLDEHRLPFDVMKPLLEETVRKAFDHGPAGAQTGPAKRNDVHVLEQHRAFLENDAVLSAFYRIFTESIAKEYNR